MRKTVIYSLLVNFFLFAIVLIIADPIYNTDEDVYVAYFLGGGFGPPTELLHYNHLMHPFLGLLLKTFSNATEGVNWYTVSLYAAHFLSCTIIFNQILKNRTRLTATIAYLVIFILIEAKFLLIPNFSNTSIICACAATTLLFTSRSFIPAILMLLLGSMFRIHPLIPIAGITLLLAFTSLPLRKALPILYSIAIGVVIILGLNIVHQSYYKSNIPNWKAAENYRQHIYKFYNHQINGLKPGDKWYAEVQMINNGLPIDTNYLSISKLNVIIKETAAYRKPIQITSSNLYWFWMENRIIITSLIVFLCFGGLNKKQFTSIIITLAVAIAGWVYLIYNFKLPEYVVMSTFFLLFLFISIFGEDRISENKFLNYARLGLVSALILWAIIQITKRDKKNENEIKAFRQAYSILQKNSTNLFISIGGAFPLQKFPSWAPPSKYPLHNLITGEHYLNNLHKPLLSKFPKESIRYLGDSLILKGQ